MKRPAFQFYPADWRNNAKLRRCSPAARGVWMDVLCLLHDSDEYGVLRWPLKDIAQAAGATASVVRELVDKGVLKGAEQGAQAYISTPRHAGTDGDPVTLVPATDGPCWYSSRFVRDEWVRSRRGAGSQFSSDNQPDDRPKRTPKQSPKAPFGERQGDGPSSSSSSSSSQKPSASVGGAAKPRSTRKCPDTFVVSDEMREWAFREAPTVDVDRETAKLRDHTFRNAITDWPGAWRNWIRRSAETTSRPAAPIVGRQAALEEHNRRVGAEWLRQQGFPDEAH